ncbi:ABC transporter permease subunit [bacterium]|nr:ABC transporter permease subunit [bacterium]
MSLWAFILERLPELGIKTWEHIILTGSSTGIAVLLGIPFGILASRHWLVQQIVLSTAGIFQTIPSLAMLAFLLPFLGIGIKPAITALVLYALLPIVRNTYTGITGIDPPVFEAADGVGFSSSQRLFMVELPLALPIIIAGIRTATVICVGIATLSAFIGAGGLGDFIVKGLAMNNTRLILLGAIPAAILALALDAVIGWIEKFTRWDT